MQILVELVRWAGLSILLLTSAGLVWYGLTHWPSLSCWEWFSFGCFLMVFTAARDILMRWLFPNLARRQREWEERRAQPPNGEQEGQQGEQGPWYRSEN